jgi:tetratricopeptide (TPR) repeat protein
MRFLLFFVFMLMATPPLRAEWHEASSDHFVIYSSQNPKTVRAYAEQLERYHNAMTLGFKQKITKPSPSNRVTIYVVRNEDQVRKLEGSGNRFVAGFYSSRAGGSVAFVPKVETNSQDLSFSEIILLHEYAHHFMYTVFAGAYPLWFSEGFAEFYASAKFDKDGSVGLGLPAKHRAGELFALTPIPIEKLLDTQAYLSDRGKSFDSFYGRSWLLFHYLSFETKREGQSATYLNKLGEGVSEIEAAKAAFGDLKLLDRDLKTYMNKRMMSYRKLSGTALTPGPINIRKLDEGETAMMPVIMQSRRGVNEESAAKVIIEARKIAAQFPNNAPVLAALAEAGFDAGNDKEAIAAADRAIAIDPKNINAHIQKGYAMMRMAPDAKDEDKAWSDVRKHFSAVNRIENDHPIPLMQFYISFMKQGRKPTENAVKGLEWALALAPFDGGLRWMVSNHYMQNKNYKDAVDTLGPLAYNPHKNENTERALALLNEAKERLAAEPRAVTK